MASPSLPSLFVNCKQRYVGAPPSPPLVVIFVCLVCAVLQWSWRSDTSKSLGTTRVGFSGNALDAVSVLSVAEELEPLASCL